MRIVNSIKNITVGIGGQILTQIVNFINRTVFIYYLGSEYLGINGLFTNVLSILSLAELGIGNAIIYSMYKPIANNDKEKIKALMKMYANSYKFIGIIIGIIGILLTFCLDFIIKDKPNISNLYIIYWLFLINSISSYFFAYKRSIITAHQKDYICLINDQKFNIIRNLFQVLSLIVVKNYILYLLIQVSFTWISNISISIKSDNMYPYIRENTEVELDKDEKNTIFKNIFALFTQRIGSVAVNSTDNLLISSFVGIYEVGVASNYYMITNMLNSFILPIFNGLTASLGNLNVGNDNEKEYDIFNKIWFLNFWIIGVCSITLYILINPFINLWIGEQYLLDKLTVFIFTINFYIYGMRRTNITYINTKGLFWYERYKPIFEAIINITSSIVLLKKYGTVGAFLGTLVSTLTTSFWVEPYIIHKYGFNKDIKKYILQYTIYLIVILFTGKLNIYICSFMPNNSMIGLILKAILSLTVSNVILIGVFYNNDNLKYFYNILKKIVIELNVLKKLAIK